MDGRPLPEGVDPDKVTWVQKPGVGSQGGYYEHDVTGDRYVPDPSRTGHWPHWDLQDQNGKGQGRFPEKSLKPRPGQLRPPYGDQSATDPWAPAQSSPLVIRIWQWVWGAPQPSEDGRARTPIYIPGFVLPAPGTLAPTFSFPWPEPSLIPAVVW
jgi:hypothetical protein